MVKLTTDNPKDVAGSAKVQMHHYPISAFLQWVKVCALGARKYGHFNWRKTGVSRAVYISAILRHVFAYMAGEKVDPESGQSHLAHAMACCGILIDAEAHDCLIEDYDIAEVLPIPDNGKPSNPEYKD